MTQHQEKTMATIKIPSLDGLKEVKEELDKARKKKPSDELVDIIAEIDENDLETDQEIPLRKIATPIDGHQDELSI